MPDPNNPQESNLDNEASFLDPERLAELRRKEAEAKQKLREAVGLPPAGMLPASGSVQMGQESFEVEHLGVPLEEEPHARLLTPTEFQQEHSGSLEVNLPPMIKVHRPQVGEAEIEAIARVIRSGNLVMGAEVEAFEKEFADYLGVDHALALNSGTSALHAALLALDLEPGDEVLVPAITFFATVEAVLYVGAIPRFTDVNERACMGIEQFLDAAQRWPRAKAVIPVHYGGHAADVVDIYDAAQRRNMWVVEDAAMAHGCQVASRYGKYKHRVGSVGHAGCFSFYATKYLTTGEGGMLTTNSDYINDRVRNLRVHGMTNRKDHVILGYNWRMNEMEAAMGRVQLKGLEERIERQRFHSVHIYNNLVDLPWLKRLPAKHHDTPCYWFCDVLLDPQVDVTRFLGHLILAGVEPRYRYTEPLYRQPVMEEVYKNLHRVVGVGSPAEVMAQYDLSCPRAVYFASHLVGLPNRPDMTHDEVERVIQVVRSFRP